jgi:hypothetical protein
VYDISRLKQAGKGIQKSDVEGDGNRTEVE